MAEASEKGPTKAPNAFILYCTKRRKETVGTDLDQRAQVTQFGCEWRQMSEAEKAPYKEQAREEMERIKQSGAKQTYRKKKTKSAQATPLSLDEAIAKIVEISGGKFQEEDIREFLKPGATVLKYANKNL